MLGPSTAPRGTPYCHLQRNHSQYLFVFLAGKERLHFQFNLSQVPSTEILLRPSCISSSSNPRCDQQSQEDGCHFTRLVLKNKVCIKMVFATWRVSKSCGTTLGHVGPMEHWFSKPFYNVRRAHIVNCVAPIPSFIYDELIKKVVWTMEVEIDWTTQVKAPNCEHNHKRCCSV